MRSRVTLSFGTMMTAPSLRSSKGIAWRSRSLMMAEESSTRQVGEQGGHLRRGDPHDDESEEADQRGRHRNHRHQARRAETFQET